MKLNAQRQIKCNKNDVCIEYLRFGDKCKEDNGSTHYEAEPFK